MTQPNRPYILITGSSGLIGSKLCEVLGEEHEVVGLDLEPDGEAQDCIPCDLTSNLSVTRALEALREQHGTCIESVIHLAAHYDFTGEESPLYEELTIGGTRRLIEGLRDFDVGQFVFCGTILEMKPVEKGEVITESSELRAEWEYPRSKLEAERLIRASDLPHIILRIAGVYDRMARAVPIVQQMKRIHEKKLESFFFPGNPVHGQPFVHIDDLAELVRLVVAKREDVRDEIFLVAEPELLSYRELQDRLGEFIHGTTWPTLPIPSSVAKAGAWIKDKIGSDDDFVQPWMIDLADAHYPVSIQHARDLLGWEPRHRLDDHLKEMVLQLLENPKAWYRENGLETENVRGAEAE